MQHFRLQSKGTFFFSINRKGEQRVSVNRRKVIRSLVLLRIIIFNSLKAFLKLKHDRKIMLAVIVTEA